MSRQTRSPGDVERGDAGARRCRGACLDDAGRGDVWRSDIWRGDVWRGDIWRGDVWATSDARPAIRHIIFAKTACAPFVHLQYFPMTPIQTLKKTGALVLGAALFATGALPADVVETKNGSRITGKVSQIDAGAVVIATDYAGDIKIKQSEIASITTDTPINARLADGRVLNGSIASTAAPGEIVLSGPAGATTTARLGDFKETWAPGAKDPELVRRERKWSFEASMDVAGKTGNSEQIGTSFSLRATLASSFDKLQLHTGYDRQITDAEKSAELFRLGADYQRNFSARFSWYARDETGFDRVKDISLYNTAAAGFGHDVIKNEIATLTFRAGLSHRYENYGTNHDPITGAKIIDDLSEPGIDLGLNNQLTMKTWSVVNRITCTPAFNDFGLYRIYHESYIELPLASPRWKFRVGVSNDYNSRPVPGVGRLDTTYFARLLLTWK
ncbi:MAG: DUF481 domain-containing protein [Opitutaceae bacterium]|nr:DUF481 domain-containing protein [Opitutaceae bacterium]